MSNSKYKWRRDLFIDFLIGVALAFIAVLAHTSIWPVFLSYCLGLTYGVLSRHD